MSLPVHLVPSLVDVAPGHELVVEGDEAHHAVAVRRLRPGQAVVLTDGAGGSVRGVVVGTDRRRLAVRVEEVDRVAPPEPRLVVVQALPKGDRGELAVELLTEVGADEVVPWAADRSVAVWRGERAAKAHARWAATAREAAKQSRRTWHPTVAPLATTAEVARRIADSELALVLHEAATRPLPEPVPDAGELLLVVGPEGGLTDAELATFTDAGATAVHLGREVLRTSTAGTAAAAALLSRTARWR